MRLLTCITTPPDRVPHNKALYNVPYNKFSNNRYFIAKYVYNKEKGKKPFDAILNRMNVKVVVQVWILALALVLASCGGSDTLPYDPDDLVAATDSAERAAWGEIGVTRSDSIRPSIFFDTTYKYFLASVLLEREKRIAIDSFARKTVLAIDRLHTGQQRQAGIKTIRELERRDSLWIVRLESIQRQYAQSISAYLDSAGVDSTEKGEIVKRLAQRTRFIPKWRDRLDSLTRETLRTQREIINFIDTANERIRIEGALQFSEPYDLVTYQGFTAKLETLAMAQSDAMQESYTADRTRRESDDEPEALPVSPTADTTPTPPVRYWPEAVRVR